MANWLKILLFGGGVAIAGVGTAYLTGSFDSWRESEQPVIAALPDAETLPEPAALQVDGEEEDASETADAADLVIPGFDLVRVEPDGSVVIAGRAAPNATVEVLTGSRIIATIQAGPDGDFAAVLDDPLEPGDYQIVLRSTTDENVVVTSVETAIVSVPETRDGQVLALVEQPGSPSRLITVPDATDAQPIDEETEVADAQEDEAAETEMAEATGEASMEVAATDATTEDEVAELATTTEEPVSQPEEATAEAELAEQDGAEALSPEEDAVAAAGSEEPVEADVAEAPSEAFEEEAETATAQLDESLQPDEETAVAAAPTEAEQDVAALQQDETFEPEASQPGAQTRVFVEAVEIDGDTVFVAGQSEPGRFVRVYANEILLGETLVSEGGRFLIEARVDLPVGDYIIRADLLGSDGTVVARAAVPFEREPGETIAAVAPRAPAPGEDAAQQTVDDDQPADTARVEEEESESATSDMAATPVDAEAEAEAEEMAAVEVPSTTADPVREDQAETDTAAAETQPSATAETEDTGAIADEPAETSEPVETAQPAEELTGEEQIAAVEDTGVPAEAEETAQAAEPDVVAADERMAAAEPSDETMSPALERANGAVIIRRGDNLWRISRRVYGQGVRYSTIYLANQDQIRNPDLIWPGQVFAVPAETVEGETADLEALGEQAVDPSQVPGEIIR